MHIRSELRAPIITGIVSATSGLGIGYILGRRKMESSVISETNIEYETVVECEKCKARSDETKGMINIVSAEGYLPDEDPGHPSTDFTGFSNVRNLPQGDHREPLSLVVDENLQSEVDGEPVEDESWNQEEEEEDRSPDTPYVITKAEWDSQETGLPQMSLSWYAGDKILVDEKAVPIPKPEVVVGYLPFGKASGDTNTVYIRNEALQAEYEVIRIDSSYMIDILGLEAEEEADAEDLKHSNMLLKFRD